MRGMAPRTTAMELADMILRAAPAAPHGGRGLEDFVATRRAEGRSWRLIAQDLADATDRKVNVAYETLRAWFPDLVARRSEPVNG